MGAVPAAIKILVWFSGVANRNDVYAMSSDLKGAEHGFASRRRQARPLGMKGFIAERTQNRSGYNFVWRFVPALTRHAWQWLTGRMKIRCDAAALRTMNERELKDIGLDYRDVCPQVSIMLESDRLRENYIMLDGLPFSGNSRKASIWRRHITSRERPSVCK